MALDAGSVFATLGGNFQPTGFVRFGAAMKAAGAQMDATEKRMQTSAQKSSASLHAIGRAAKVGAGAGILGLGAAIAGSVKKAADFEAQLSSLQSVSGATGKQMDALRKSAMAAGAATKYSALDAAAAQTELAKGGLSTAKILGGGLKGALALAAAGEMELAAAASTTANALNLFGLGGGKATHVADALAQAANSTTADVSDFAMALTQGGGAAKAAGLSFDQTVVALESLAKAGVKGSDAGTSLKAMLTQVAKPSKESAAAMEDLNLTFFDAQGNFKNMARLSGDLGRAFQGKTAQEKLALATTIAGTDGQRALLSVLNASPEVLRKYATEVARQGTAADVAAKKQDNLKGRLENLRGSVETAGIALGTKLLPMFEKLAVQGTDWINKLVANGQVDQFAAGIASAFQTMGEVLRDVASVGKPIVGVFADIASALGGLDATKIEALIAGFAAFKVAGVVGPMVAVLAHALQGLMIAAKAGALTQMGAALLTSVGPLKALTVAAGLLAGALVLLGGSHKNEATAARDAADAQREHAAAVDASIDATLAAADASFGAKRAEQDLARAKNETTDAADKYGKKSKEYRDALQSEREANLRNVAAQKRMGDEKKRAREEADRAREASEKDVEAAREEIDAVLRGAFTAKSAAEQREKLTRAVDKYSAAQARATQTGNVAALQQMQLQRLLAGGDLITNKNARAVANLAGVYKDLPKVVRTKIDALPQAALAKIGGVIGRLRGVDRAKATATILARSDSATATVLAFKALLAGVPLRKVSQILANTSGKAEIDALRSSIDSVQSKSVTVTTNYVIRGKGPANNAAGRGPGGSEVSLVGEGGGPEWVVNPKSGRVDWVPGPTVMRLAPEEYVIPTESRYRGRALGLLADVAASLGVAYKKGKKGKVGGVKVTKPSTVKQALGAPIPAQIAEGGVDFAAVASDHSRIHGNHAQAVKDRKGAQKRFAAAEHRLERVPKGSNYDRTRSNAKDALNTATKELRKAKDREKKLEPMAAYVDRLFKAARETDSKAKGYQSEMNVHAGLMQDADRKGDQGAYNAARTSRQGALRNLIVVLQRAYSLARPNSAYGRRLREQLVALGGQNALNGVAPTETNMSDFGGDLGDPALSGGEQTAISDADSAAKEVADTAATAAKEAADKAREVAAGRQLSDADQATLDNLTRDFALAELDTPDDVTDDLAVQEKLVDFFGGILTGLRSSPTATPRAIAEAADTLRGARSNLKELASRAATTGSGGTGSEAFAAAVAEEVGKFNNDRMTLYRDFGSNFIDKGRGLAVRDVINNYAAPPPDPHTWSRGLEFELRGVGG